MPISVGGAGCWPNAGRAAASITHRDKAMIGVVCLIICTQLLHKEDVVLNPVPEEPNDCSSDFDSDCGHLAHAGGHQISHLTEQFLPTVSALFQNLLYIPVQPQ